MIQCKKKALIVTFWYLYFFYINTIYAEKQSALDFRGSMYSDAGMVHTFSNRDKASVDYTGMSVFSIGMKNTNREYGKVEGLFDLLIPYGKTAKVYMPYLTDSSETSESIHEVFKLFSFGNAPLLFDVRKLYLSLYLPFADITMGRQIINFGKGLLFSPIDVFSTVEAGDIHLRRRGSDIVSMRIPFSDLSGIDLISGLPFIDGSFSIAGKIFASFTTFDLSLITLYRDRGIRKDIENEIIGGVTCKGDLGLGFYSELVGHYFTESHDTFFEGMGGIDYSIRNKWYFIGEYLFKQYTISNCLWGTHNLFGSVRYTINDLTFLSVNGIYDFQSETTQGTIQWYYNILQNVNTTLYMQGFDNSKSTSFMYALRIEVKF